MQAILDLSVNFKSKETNCNYLGNTSIRGSVRSSASISDQFMTSVPQLMKTPPKNRLMKNIWPMTLIKLRRSHRRNTPAYQVFNFMVSLKQINFHQDMQGTREITRLDIMNLLTVLSTLYQYPQRLSVKNYKKLRNSMSR